METQSIDNPLRFVCAGNEWDCQFNFSWALALHERGVLMNGENLICQDESQEESWINWRYSIIRQEINKRVRIHFFHFGDL